jgi:prenyltransferase beta subunit
MHRIEIEFPRTCEVGCALLNLGLSSDDEDIVKLRNAALKSDKQSTAAIFYSADLLAQYPDSQNCVQQVENLLTFKNMDGGFGRFRGDRSRIPVSWRVLRCLKNCNVPEDKVRDIATWIEEEWSRDMNRGGLSYKCAGSLIAHHHYPIFSESFIEKTLNWLLADQNPDGGWSAKQGAPVGSAPSYTGLALRALFYYASKEEVKKAIEKGIEWIKKNELASGLWKEHPVEKACIEIALFIDSYLKCKN